MSNGETIVPDDGREINQNNDPCIRYVKEYEPGTHELVPVKKVMGAHKWLWQDLLKMRVCSTCGVERPFTKRFEGQ